jgi:hypothetical protein
VGADPPDPPDEPPDLGRVVALDVGDVVAVSVGEGEAPASVATPASVPGVAVSAATSDTGCAEGVLETANGEWPPVRLTASTAADRVAVVAVARGRQWGMSTPDYEVLRSTSASVFRPSESA